MRFKKTFATNVRRRSLNVGLLEVMSLHAARHREHSTLFASLKWLWRGDFRPQDGLFFKKPFLDSEMGLFGGVESVADCRCVPINGMPRPDTELPHVR